MEKLITQLRILKEMDLKPNYAALAREYGCDWRTVKKYNEGYTGGDNTRNKSSKLDKYSSIIKEKLQYKGVHIKSVYEFLIDKYSFENVGTYSNFHKYVVKNKFFVNKNKSKTVRYETRPGKQAQVDWKEDMDLISKHGEVFNFNVFSFKLGNSRYVYYEYRKEKTREDLFECLINAFKFIGGVPEEILFDNMASVVDINTGKVNAKFLAFAKDMGFKVKRCKPRTPKTKGKVETCNKFIEWLIPYNNEFEDEKDLIDLICMINTKVNTTVNQTTRVTPMFLFQKEKEYLLPISRQSILDQYTKKIKKYLVYPDSLIYYNNKRYSVPSKYIGQYVNVQQIDSYLYIYFNTFLIGKHKISEKIFNYEKEHYKELLALTVKDEVKLEEYTNNNLKIYDIFLQEVENKDE